jgi:hypothetical protein
MKKLNKLQINSEKLMKNEELLTLRGGYDPICPPGQDNYHCFYEKSGQMHDWEGCAETYSVAMDRCGFESGVTCEGCYII